MFNWVTKQKAKKGFTILELLVVMAIIAFLVMMAVPRYLGYTKDAAVNNMRIDVRVLEQASYQYALQNDDAWPVGAAIDYDEYLNSDGTAVWAGNTTLSDILDNAIGNQASGTTLTAAAIFDEAIAGEDKLFEIDYSQISPYIRSLYGDAADYFIVGRYADPTLDGAVTGYNNELEGFVFKKEPLDDSDGVAWSGIFNDQ